MTGTPLIMEKGMATEKTILVGITEITGITEMEITEMEITVMVTAIPKPEVLIMD